MYISQRGFFYSWVRVRSKGVAYFINCFYFERVLCAFHDSIKKVFLLFLLFFLHSLTELFLLLFCYRWNCVYVHVAILHSMNFYVPTRKYECNKQSIYVCGGCEKYKLEKWSYWEVNKINKINLNFVNFTHNLNLSQYQFTRVIQQQKKVRQLVCRVTNKEITQSGR